MNFANAMIMTYEEKKETKQQYLWFVSFNPIGVYTDVHFHRHWILEHLPETDSDITNGSAATKSGLVIIASFIFFQLIVLLS